MKIHTENSRKNDSHKQCTELKIYSICNKHTLSWTLKYEKHQGPILGNIRTNTYKQMATHKLSTLHQNTSQIYIS